MRINIIRRTANLISNMGLRYLFFRTLYTIKTKSGWQKRVFPTQPKSTVFTTLESWRGNLPPFFFYGKNISNLTKQESEILKDTFQDIKKGVFIFFNKTKIELNCALCPLSSLVLSLENPLVPYPVVLMKLSMIKIFS